MRDGSLFIRESTEGGSERQTMVMSGERYIDISWNSFDRKVEAILKKNSGLSRVAYRNIIIGNYREF